MFVAFKLVCALEVSFCEEKGMPVFDGVRTLKSLKQLESYELPKFVCFTANAINGAREYYRSEGFDEYLAKPIDVKELDRAPEWDGHTPDQAIERIGSLTTCGGYEKVEE